MSNQNKLIIQIENIVLYIAISRTRNNFRTLFRNINGRNILVKRDMSCCLCNFDHVVVTNSSGQQPFQAFNVLDNNRSLVTNENESEVDGPVAEVVGQPRYLAPEILDHALGLQNVELSLKQVDVYAMGLVFWEISRRCRDLYQV